jgi:hypothetical protein
MCTYATSHIWETNLQNCQILGNLLGNIEIFRLLKSDFPHTKFNFLLRLSNFLQRLFAFFNGFPIFFNGFPLSSMAFHIPRNPRKSIYGNKYTKDHYSSFVFPATCSPGFVIPATMSTSHPTHSCGAPVFPTVQQI